MPNTFYFYFQFMYMYLPSWVLISLYLGAFKLVLNVKSILWFVIYWREETETVCITNTYMYSVFCLFKAKKFNED